MLELAAIVTDSIVDGPGIRTCVFCQGCPHHCPGCHNPQSWDEQGGQPIAVEDLLRLIIDADMNVTFTGGDPMLHPEGFIALAQLIRQHTDKTIWCYTGFKYEDIQADQRLSQILPYLDVLVDGPFIQSLRNTDLLFRGSSNQRIIDVKKTIAADEICLWEG